MWAISIITTKEISLIKHEIIDNVSFIFYDTSVRLRFVVRIVYSKSLNINNTYSINN